MTMVHTPRRQTIRLAQVAGALWAAALGAWCATDLLCAAEPPVHYLDAGVMPPGAIGTQQLMRGGPFEGYFQPVEIKVETFPFTLYGTIPGKVLTVSDDAAPVEKVGLMYPTRVSMSRGTIQVDGRSVNLTPGMAVTVEIKIGQRRMIEYLLSPLLKSVKESMRER